jgi:hypothetical protein
MTTSTPPAEISHGQRRLEFVRGGGRGDDPSTQRGGDVGRRQPDATPSPEDEHPLAGGECGPPGQGEQHGAVTLDEGGGLVEVDGARHRHQRERRHHHLFGEAAETGEGDDPVTAVDPVDPGSDLDHHPGNLASGDEGHRWLDLVSALADEPVDEIHPCGPHVHHHLALARYRRIPFFEDQGLEWAKLPADDGAHGQNLPPGAGARF